MSSRRDQIRMSEEEVAAFLAEPHTLAVATLGRDGRPHLVAMWYGFLDGSLALWTYGKSQKVVNLRRDPRMTGMVETGGAYDQLRGVELLGRGVVVDDAEAVRAAGESVWERYMGPLDDEARDAVRQLGSKRVAVCLEVEEVVSWDHRKLGGAR